MAILLGYVASYTLHTLNYQGYSPTINISFYSNSPKTCVVSDSGLKNFAVTSNLPVSFVTREVHGTVQRNWWDDFYNRVHISPSTVDVGNLLSNKEYGIEVWSAYTTPKLLSDIISTGADGVLLPVTTPIYFGATESRIYPLTVTTNGPVNISANYTFEFEDESPELIVKGSRSVLWPFIPQDVVTEKLQWKTDILKSKNTEQRLALRVAPRQMLGYDYLLNEKEFSKAKAISSKWGNKVYGIPVWTEMTEVSTPIAKDQKVIYFDTRFADYRKDSFAVIWKSDSNYEIVEIEDVFPDRITLKLGTMKPWDGCLIAPCRKGRTLQGISYSRSAVKDVKSKAEFLIIDNTDLADELDFVLYRSKPVLTDRTVVVNDLEESISNVLQYFDNGSGPVEVETESNILNNSQTISFKKNTYEDTWKLRQWLHARRGCQKPFWLPSWNKDLVLLEEVNLFDTKITVEDIGYSLYYSIKDIMIVLKSGQKIFKRILSGNSLVGGQEELSLSEPMGYAFQPEDVDFICFITHVRLDSDEVTVSYDSNKIAKTQISVKETPE